MSCRRPEYLAGEFGHLHKGCFVCLSKRSWEEHEEHKSHSDIESVVLHSNLTAPFTAYSAIAPTPTRLAEVTLSPYYRFKHKTSWLTGCETTLHSIMEVGLHIVYMMPSSRFTTQPGLLLAFSIPGIIRAPSSSQTIQRYSDSARRFAASSVSHRSPFSSSFCLSYKSSSCDSVENSKLGPSTIASTGHASWQKPQ